MPTIKPHHLLTDTGELREMLDAAQRRWPEVEDRMELLLKLVEAGHRTIEREAVARRHAVGETAGSLSGVYETGELQRLRGDWPA